MKNIQLVVFAVCLVGAGDIEHCLCRCLSSFLDGRKLPSRCEHLSSQRTSTAFLTSAQCESHGSTLWVFQGKTVEFFLGIGHYKLPLAVRFRRIAYM